MLLVWGTRFGALVTLFRDVVYIATVIGLDGLLYTHWLLVIARNFLRGSENWGEVVFRRVIK